MRIERDSNHAAGFFELRKITRKPLVGIFILVFLFTNVLFCLYNVPESDYILHNAIKSLFELYDMDPEYVEEMHTAYNDFMHEETINVMEHRKRGDMTYTARIPEAVFAPEGYTDASLYFPLYNAINYADSYPTVIEKVLKDAEANLKEYEVLEIPNDSFAVRSAQRTIDDYTYVAKVVRPEICIVYGWEEFFSCTSFLIFMFFSLILVDAVLFVQEISSGFMPVLRTTRCGRFPSAMAKLGAMVIVNLCIVLLFTGSTLAIYWYRCGLSNPNIPIQQLSTFCYCPYSLTILEYFFLTLLLRLCASLAFSATLVMISVFFYEMIVPFLVGIGLLSLSYSVTSMPAYQSGNYLHFDLLSIAECTALVEQARYADIFGNPYSYLSVALVGYLVIFVVLLIVTTLRYVYGLTEVSDHVKLRLIRKHGRNGNVPQAKAVRIQHRYIPICSAEGSKMLGTRSVLLILIVLLCTKFSISVTQNRAADSFGEAVYRAYMTNLAGSLTEEKRQYIVAERTRIDTAIKNNNNIEQAYFTKEITRSEYMEKRNEYNYARSHDAPLILIEEHLDYIETIAQGGGNAWFIYDTGWRKLYNSSFDWTLYAVILLLCSSSFAVEYKGTSSQNGFAQILRTTKYGRRRTFYSKCVSAAVLSISVCIIWHAIDFVMILLNYELPLMEAPIASILGYNVISSEWNMVQYGIIWIFLRIVAALFLGLFCTALSQLTRRRLFAMTVAAAMTLVPCLLDIGGVSSLTMFDFTAFMRTTPMVIMGWDVYIIFIAIFTGLIILLALLAAKQWIGNRYRPRRTKI